MAQGIHLVDANGLEPLTPCTSMMWPKLPTKYCAARRSGFCNQLDLQQVLQGSKSVLNSVKTPKMISPFYYSTENLGTKY